ncbi:urea transporter [Hymenobacter actinosclerus]|uniref:Urea transporter n=1 Tax=Hymenobacter actinosclerus TaxID=82805 RepID=A0A1I0J8L0_9BACT|nr:urea transporter [Hymenobacter actinosclerus]SEU05575.1 urea transporter [Hymenobacter actinosclerus]
MRADSTELLTANLRGVGQIFLQESAWTGALLLLGICYGSPLMGAAVGISTLVGTGTARLLSYDQGHISRGLYGFNAALVGAGLSVFFAPTILLALVILVAVVLSTVVMHWFLRRELPAYTFPFILLTWLGVYALHLLGAPGAAAGVLAPAPNIGALVLVSRGFGQVIFQGEVLVGAVFFLAIFIHSPISALYGLVGALLGAAAALLMHEPAESIALGLFSFNGVLCGVAFAGSQRRDGLLVLVAVLLSVAINALLARGQLLALTFPFVLASWLTLLLKRLFPSHSPAATD